MEFFALYWVWLLVGALVSCGLGIAGILVAMDNSASSIGTIAGAVWGIFFILLTVPLISMATAGFICRVAEWTSG